MHWLFCFDIQTQLFAGAPIKKQLNINAGTYRMELNISTHSIRIRSFVGAGVGGGGGGGRLGRIDAKVVAEVVGGGAAAEAAVGWEIWRRPNDGGEVAGAWKGRGEETVSAAGRAVAVVAAGHAGRGRRDGRQAGGKRERREGRLEFLVEGRSGRDGRVQFGRRVGRRARGHRAAARQQLDGLQHVALASLQRQLHLGAPPTGKHAQQDVDRRTLLQKQICKIPIY